MSQRGITDVATGDVLIDRVIAAEGTDRALEVLIRLAEVPETYWFELKASTRSRSQDMKRGEKADDGPWNVIRAAVAMLNGCGGGVVIGIDDKCEAVGLGASHPDGELPVNAGEIGSFVKKYIIDAYFFSNRGWETKGGNRLLDRHFPKDSVRHYFLKYQGKIVLLIVIRPLPSGADLLYVKCHKETLLPWRSNGAQGEVIELPATRFADVAASRQTESDWIAGLWRKYERSRNMPGGDGPCEGGGSGSTPNPEDGSCGRPRMRLARHFETLAEALELSDGVRAAAYRVRAGRLRH